MPARGGGYYQQQPQYGYGNGYGNRYGQPVYAAPVGSPFGGPYSSYGGRGRYGNNSGFGGGGVALPLIGGLAGGLLLGDLLGGGFDNGGGFF